MDELVIVNKPKSNISESIRTVRTNLSFSCVDNGSKVFLVTSSIPSEGKTFISSNLSAAFANAGDLTLVIDCDLRLGRIHEVFGLSNKLGLSNMLVDSDLSNYGNYIKKTSVPNLFTITRGTVPPNPSELLNSNRARSVINWLRKSFDTIILDGLPINGLPDSLIVAGLVDKVVLVTACNKTKIDELIDAKKALDKVDAKIAGIVVNGVNKSKRGKYYKYYGYTKE